MRRPFWAGRLEWLIRAHWPDRRPRFTNPATGRKVYPLSRWEWWIDPYWTALCWRVTGRCLSCGLKRPGHKMGCSERPSGGQVYLVARDCPDCHRAVMALPGQTVSGCADHLGRPRHDD